MKSAVTENLGFAVAINRLKELLAKPNSVPMTAWKTIGNLDPDEWKPMLGANWRQRAGRILVEEPGSGFGGRSYCLNMTPTPKLPFEVAVTLKLDDESGAAGLIFHAGDDGRHYGFYPSGGGFRLTRFDGSDVYSWKILEQATSEVYKPGEWNTIKVRLEKGKILCYVNDKLTIESNDTELTEGKVGLAKFRQTKAEFKNFRVAAKLGGAAVSAEAMARIEKELASLKPATSPTPEQLAKLSKEGAASMEAIRQHAKQLEEQAKRLRQIAVAIHHNSIQEEMKKVLASPSPDLIHAALLIAKLDNEELDIDAYRRDVERMAKKITGKLPKDADEKAKIKALNDYLFNERGFHGSRSDYYNRSNSYLNEVLDDREGLPIALSVIYMEVGRQVGLKIEGVGLPGHFVVRHVPKKGEPQLIDVFDGGKLMSRADAEKKVKEITGEGLDESVLATVTPKAIVVRMLNNLLRLATDDRDPEGSLRYLDLIIGIDPSTGTVRERGMRAMARAQLGDKPGALADLDWILEKMPEDVDLDAIRAIRRRVERSR
jgi:regulator of sirC expression with transglutaminase-like and TPR domain